MAVRSMAVEPLVGTNYVTWKLQCQSLLMRDGLWGVVGGEARERPDGVEARAKYDIF